MKDRWKFCQCCYLNGHCENQDRGMKCEHYSKQLEDKVERLQEQLKEANEVIKKYMSVAFEIRSEKEKPTVLQLAFDYLEKWGVK